MKGGLSMGVNIVLILLGSINMIIGCYSNIVDNRMAFTGIGIGFYISAIIVSIVNFLKIK